MKTPIRFLFALLCVSLFGTAQGQTKNPNRQSSIPYTKTRWVAKVDNPNDVMARGRFELWDVSRGEPGVLINSDFPVKGMCYSPIRINENIDFARWLSDIFWDNVASDPMAPSEHKHGQIGGLLENYRFNWADGQCMLPNTATCRGDLTTLNELNVNTIRVYGMTSRFNPVERTPPYRKYTPDPIEQNNPNLVARCTHKQFLDDCAAHGIYVIVGLFLDAKFWDKRTNDLKNRDHNIRNIIAWFDQAYKEVVQEVGNHPAVMGFCINNEIDGVDIVYRDPESAEFFWEQMRRISSTVKRLAPDKLVGVAFHNNQEITWGAQDYMKTVPDIDYWGINVYVTDAAALANIFFIDSPRDHMLGYSKLPSQAKKPVLFTEIGWPQTTRTTNDASCPGRLSMTDDNTTVTQAVGNLWRLLGGALNVPPAQKEMPLCPGTMYFEFNDEWFKDGEKHPDCTGGKQLCTWIGAIAGGPGFPGGWWDDDGFGVYSVKRAQGVADCDRTFDYLPQYNYFGPLQAYDTLELGQSAPNTRTYIHDAVRDVYGTPTPTPTPVGN